MLDLVSRNEVSGRRGATLINDMDAAGAAGVRDLITSKKWLQNAPRSLRRKFRKSGWPPLYECMVRCWNQKTQAEELQKLYMWLPHEVLDRLEHFGHMDVLTGTEGLDDVSAQHHREAKAALGGLDDVVACGIWQDGVPCNWDRSVSAEIVALLLPGLGDRYKNLRVPIACLLKHQLSEHTLDDIFEVIRWSFMHLAAQKWPSRRHDQTAFGRGDEWRARRYGEGRPLPVRGVICQIKGDWKMFKEVLKLPGWADDEICFQCKIRRHEARGHKIPWLGDAER